MFSLRPVRANESWPPASVQPLSAAVWALGHSWSIPLCFHGSVWSLSAEAERSPLTGVWTDRVKTEFTRLSLGPAVPLAPSLFCVLSVFFFVFTILSSVPSTSFVSPSALALLSVSMGTARLLMEWVGWRIPSATLTAQSPECKSWWGQESKLHKRI